MTLSFTLPFWLSCFFFFPFAFINSWASPALDRLADHGPGRASLAPLPDPVSSPGFGTLTVGVALPFFLLRVGRYRG